MQRVWLVGGQMQEQQDLVELLRASGWWVQVFPSLDALERNGHEKPFAVVLDADRMELEDRDIRRVRKRWDSAGILIVSSQSYHPRLEGSMGTEICACIRRPLDDEEVNFLLRNVCGSGRLPKR
jgi:DNA-binding NtrC family response regulator